MQERVGWIDFARGAAIALVVFGHVWRGLMRAGLLADGSLYTAVDDGIYLFHMPLFFFVSGLLFTASDQRRRLGESLWRPAWRLLYPLALWTYIFAFARVIVGNLANRPISMEDVPTFPLPPYEYLWFVWALFLIQIVVGLAHRIAGFGWYGLLLALAFNVTVALALNLADQVELNRLFSRAVDYMPFFLLGMAFTARPFSSSPLRALVAVVLLGLLVSTAPQWFAAGSPWRWFAAGAAVLCCVPLTVEIQRFLMNSDPLRYVAQVVQAIGMASLAIYLAHVLFSAGARILLEKAEITNLWMHAFVGTAVGIAGPMALLVISRKFKIEKWLGLDFSSRAYMGGQRNG